MDGTEKSLMKNVSASKCVCILVSVGTTYTDSKKSCWEREFKQKIVK